ncbi:ATP-binding cassette domain-containing protein [Pseudonocardia alaniniphila]|uniref:ATP-binding cassette domain-containing protein n=1 Tax=Pseudonocardia alaniniphila TaxID=75291 RepID=A0ABS9TRJ8_9PSEU|nr:ATP-binding cassette domain-containing protein [Pseudonocardia alaniniphila]MCH6170856.1 ATP-binding cassette domain-containing protein [Pseudonocardia alaniniphila]
MSRLLDVTGLRVTYRGRPPVRAVDGVDLAVEAGQVVGLVGESGCGKSTIARAVCGLVKPAGGTVTFDGMPVAPLGLRRRPPALTRVQMVFQDPYASLHPRRAIGVQIGDGVRAAVARGAAPSEPAEWLRRVGLDPDAARRYPHEFSGGQRQRIAIARALAARPDLLIGDEPISALDASTQAVVAALMRDLAVDSGAGLLFISHDLSVVRLIADRLVVMYRGRVVESGPAQEIWSDPQHPYTQALLAAVPVPDGSGRMPAPPVDDARYPQEAVLR